MGAINTIRDQTDKLDRDVDEVMVALIDETEVPGEAIPRIQSDITALRERLNTLESLLTTGA